VYKTSNKTGGVIMKKGLILLSAVLILTMFFSGCGIGVSVKIPTFTFQMDIGSSLSQSRALVSGTETANKPWDKVDTQGFNVRELYLNPKLVIYPDSTETLDTEIDFKLYLSEEGANQRENLFLEDTIEPATKTYNWKHSSKDNDGVAFLLDLIKEHKSTTLVFTLDYTFHEFEQGMEPVPVEFTIKGNANVGF